MDDLHDSPPPMLWQTPVGREPGKGSILMFVLAATIHGPGYRDRGSHPPS
jgi:hypothetical protein